MKPGIKTSEFWMALVAQLLSLGVLTGVISPEQAVIGNTGGEMLIGGCMSIISAVGYILSRGIAKLKE